MERDTEIYGGDEGKEELIRLIKIVRAHFTLYNNKGLVKK